MSAIDTCPRCGSNFKHVGAIGKCDTTAGFAAWHASNPPDSFTTGTHIDSPTNSTRFTNCCNLAVSPGDRCPGCHRAASAATRPHDDGKCLMCRKPRSRCCC